MDYEKMKKFADRMRSVTSQSGNKYGIVNTKVNIYSDGTRMSGTIWKPDGLKSGEKRAAILLLHGWGGVRDHFDFSYARKFCQAGYVVLTFDYRGWGDSDAILITEGEQPKPDSNGFVQVKARALTKIVDPEWQLRDARSALDFLTGVEHVDSNNIGIWGTSFGGGHVIALGAKDPRVKCIVSQVSSIDAWSNWRTRYKEAKYRGAHAIRKLATEQAQGKSWVWNMPEPSMVGKPNLPKIVFEHSGNCIGSADQIRVPLLLLPATDEELIDNEKNARAVHAMLRGKVPCEIHYIEGGHYSAYENPGFSQGCEKSIEWFDLHIGKTPPAAKL